MITRRPTRGYPQYDDANESDVFVFSGAEDLVPVYRQDLDGTWVADHSGFTRDADGGWVRDASGRHVVHEDECDGYRIRRYRPRIEGTFARIERWTKDWRSGDVHWRSDLQGQRALASTASTNVRIADPARPPPHLQLADL